MVEKLHDHAQCLTELKEVNLDLTPEMLGLMSNVMGFDVSVPATAEQIERSQHWINSPQKRILEQGICRLFGIVGGRYLANRAARSIEGFDGKDGFVVIQAGFLGLESEIYHPEIKVRTMVPGASDLLPSEFQHTLFKGGRVGKDFKDERVLNCPTARRARRTGIDEFPQLYDQIPRGKMILVGARGYTPEEK